MTTYRPAGTSLTATGWEAYLANYAALTAWLADKGARITRYDPKADRFSQGYYLAPLQYLGGDGTVAIRYIPGVCTLRQAWGDQRGGATADRLMLTALTVLCQKLAADGWAAELVPDSPTPTRYMPQVRVSKRLEPGLPA